MAWEDFALLLFEQYGARCFVIGRDFRFGHEAQGNAQNLGEWCRKRNIHLEIIDEVYLAGQPVRSSRIRSLLQAGEMAEAMACLGRAYTLSGEVLRGRQLGRTLGYPTANICPPAEKLLPKKGVYRSLCVLEGQSFPSISNIGCRPTVDGAAVVCESHLIGLERSEFYGAELTVMLLDFVREERTFGSLEALKEQIKQDIGH